MTETTIRVHPPEPPPCDDRPVAYHCFGCARHYVPKGTPKPLTDSWGQPAIDRSGWQWREFLCPDPDCPANAIAKGMRK